MPTTSTKPHSSPPLPLEDLTAWVSSSCLVHNKGSKKKSSGEGEESTNQPATVLEWLEEGDVQAAKWQEEMEANGADQIVDFFAMSNNDDDDSDAASVDSNVDFEGVYGRIRVWESSTENVDGVGSKFRGEEEEKESNDSDGVKLTYIISEAWEGYGVSLVCCRIRHIILLLQLPVPSESHILLCDRLGYSMGLIASLVQSVCRC